jgi:hypothetical protein
VVGKVVGNLKAGTIAGLLMDLFCEVEFSLTSHCRCLPLNGDGRGRRSFFSPFFGSDFPVSLVPQIGDLPRLYSSSVTGTAICLIRQGSNHSLPMFRSWEMLARGYADYPDGIPTSSASVPRGAKRTAYRRCVDFLLYASLRVEWTHHSHHDCGVRNEASPEFLVPVPDELGIFTFKGPNGAWARW